MFRAAQQHVGLDPEARQFAHRVLRGLGLELARSRNIGHERDVDAERLPRLEFVAQLADRLHERQAFDIAHRAADLAQDEIVIVLPCKREGLDLVGDMRNHLHRRAEIVAAPLLGDDILVYPARSDVVALMRRNAGEAFVVAEVEIGLGPVIGHIDLTVLIRGHRPRIDVEIGVEFPDTDLVATRLEEGSKRCCHETFAKRGDHAAGDKDIPRHGGRALS